MSDRNLTALEKVLEKHGFTEMFGLGLYAKTPEGVAVDTNSGMAKVIPNIDASFDDFIDIYDEDQVDKLEAKLKELGLTID